MFCPNCGLREDRAVQFCRTCGTDLRAVRDTLMQPNSVAASTAVAREEIARAAAAKIKDGQWWQVGAIVPEVEKLFESPEDRRLRLIRADEEQRLRRIRAGVVTAASGLGAVLLFLLLSFAKNDLLFLVAPSLTVLLVGLGIVINGLLFTVPKQSALNRRLDGHQRDRLDLPPSKVAVVEEVLSPPEPSLLPRSVTDQTTRHLSSELLSLPSRNQEE
jgi:hypothetical protein